MLALDFTDVTLADGGAIVQRSWRDGWTPPPIQTVSEWADSHRKLPSEAAAEPGAWRTSRTPYLRQIMDDLSVHSPVQEVNIKKSTQVGGTEVGINFLGHIIDHAPGPLMYVLPTLDIARKFSEQRLQPMIDLMPCLSRAIGPRRSRDSGNTTLTKKFPAGFLVLSGANSAASLASMPVKFLVLDELSKYPADLDSQGSAQVQAERRTSSFTTRKKILRISSPTIVDACAISDEYDRGSQGVYHVPCPHCRQTQPLLPDQLTDEGQFLCVHCGQLIDEKHKTWMLAEAGHSADGLAHWVHKHPERAVRSYHLWAAYAATRLGYTWKEIADMRAEARKDADKEVTFVNTILGMAYEGSSQRVEATEVEQRAEAWQRRTIPRGCLMLTASVDVQANRFSIAIWGWGRGEVARPIDWVELPGDPTRKEDWAVVDEYLAQPLVNSCGLPMRPLLTAVDSGNWTKEVYDYVRPRQQQGFIAIKGAKAQGAALIARPSKKESTTRGTLDRKGVRLWHIGVTTAKTTLMQRLLKDAEFADHERRRFRFPGDLPTEFYQQLTAERFDLTAMRWVKAKSARNEVLDLLVYAYAAACSPMVRLHTMREADWASLESRLEPAIGDMFSGPADGGAAPAAVPPPAPAPAPAPQSASPAAAAPQAGAQPPAALPRKPAQPPAAPSSGARGFGSEGWGFGSRN